MFRPRAGMQPSPDHGFKGVRYFRRRVRPDITFSQKRICGAGALLDYGLTPTFAAGLYSDPVGMHPVRVPSRILLYL